MKLYKVIASSDDSDDLVCWIAASCISQAEAVIYNEIGYSFEIKTIEFISDRVFIQKDDYEE
jgi:hypothetical protein